MNLDTQLQRDPTTLASWAIASWVPHFLSWVSEFASKSQVGGILFISREGQFLDSAWKQMGLPSNAHYLPVSRTLVNRLIAYKENRIFSPIEDSPYSGTVESFLKSRLGFNQQELSETLNRNELSRSLCLGNLEERETLLVGQKILERFNADLDRETAYFKAYLNSLTNNSQEIAVVDLGYSGTIQLGIEKITNVTTSGLYVLTAKVPKESKKFSLKRTGWLLTDGIWGESPLLDNSLRLEALFQSVQEKCTRYEATNKGARPVIEFQKGNDAAELAAKIQARALDIIRVRQGLGPLDVKDEILARELLRNLLTSTDEGLVSMLGQLRFLDDYLSPANS